MAQAIFDVVSENIKRPHVAEQMPEAAMQKHKWQEWKKLIRGAEINADLRIWIARRHQAENIYETIPVDAQWQLKQENEYIDADEDVVDDRIIFGPGRITQRDHRFIEDWRLPIEDWWNSIWNLKK